MDDEGLGGGSLFAYHTETPDTWGIWASQHTQMALDVKCFIVHIGLSSSFFFFFFFFFL
jgi:hypothetical protein